MRLVSNVGLTEKLLRKGVLLHVDLLLFLGSSTISSTLLVAVSCSRLQRYCFTFCTGADADCCMHMFGVKCSRTDHRGINPAPERRVIVGNQILKLPRLVRICWRKGARSAEALARHVDEGGIYNMCLIWVNCRGVQLKQYSSRE